MLLWIHGVHLLIFTLNIAHNMRFDKNVFQFKGIFELATKRNTLFSVCSKQFMKYNPTENFSVSPIMSQIKKPTHANVY